MCSGSELSLWKPAVSGQHGLRRNRGLGGDGASALGEQRALPPGSTCPHPPSWGTVTALTLHEPPRGHVASESPRQQAASSRSGFEPRAA